jgi:biopolymer transport protein ExbB/TolQ
VFNQQIAIGAGLLFFVFFTMLYFYVGSLKSEIKELKLELVTTQGVLMKEKLNTSTLRISIDKQNEAINSLGLENKNAQNKLKEWREKPADIKYKTIQTIREIKSDECEQIKNSLNAIKSIGYNSP